MTDPVSPVHPARNRRSLTRRDPPAGGCSAIAVASMGVVIGSLILALASEQLDLPVCAPSSSPGSSSRTW